MPGLLLRAFILFYFFSTLLNQYSPHLVKRSCCYLGKEKRNQHSKELPEIVVAAKLLVSPSTQGLVLTTSSTNVIQPF